MKPIATAVAMLLSALLPAAAGAVDVSAGDLAPLPPGTNLAFLYGLYTDSNQYDLPGGGTVAGSNHLESATAIARYVHYLSIFGLTVAPQILVPYGALYNLSLIHIYLSISCRAARDIGQTRFSQHARFKRGAFVFDSNKGASRAASSRAQTVSPSCSSQRIETSAGRLASGPRIALITASFIRLAPRRRMQRSPLRSCRMSAYSRMRVARHLLAQQR